MKKEYQLIFQWPASTLEDFDLIMKVEAGFRRNLQSKHCVDGHDMGSGEANIFVLTHFPVQAFTESLNVLKELDMLKNIKVAYREVLKDAYIVLWPEGSLTFEIK